MVRRDAIRTALVAMALASVFLGLRVAGREVPPPGTVKPWNVFTDTYWPPSNQLEAAINIADGQAWATIAVDPLISRPEHYDLGRNELVYRGQRPLIGWVVIILAAGQPAAVPYALALLTVASIGFLVAASMFLAVRVGRDPKRAWVVAIMPGALLSVVLLTPDPLPVALAVLGVYWWLGGTTRDRMLAVAAFVAAALGRELLVLVPAVLALNQLVIGRVRVRRVLPLGLPVVASAGWIGSLRVRYGIWPTAADQVERVGLPFTGWVHALDHIEPLAWFSYALAVVLLVLAFRRDARSPLTWIAASFALLTMVIGENVLSTEPYRPLLCLWVFAVIVILPPAPKSAVKRATAVDVSSNT